MRRKRDPSKIFSGRYVAQSLTRKRRRGPAGARISVERLPELLSRVGLREHAKKTARCPFPGHQDKHPSFSVFQGDDGFWHYMCFSKCGDGDEIMFLSKLKGLSLPAAMTLYLEMAGFRASRPSKSREYPKSPASPESLSICVSESPCVSVYPVSPVSEGQGLDKELEKELKGLAARNACSR